MDYIKFLWMIIFAYFVGSIPFGVWLGRIFLNKDIRNEGSGGIGFANAYRVLGLPLGILTLILDIAKGYVPLGYASSLQFLPWQIIVIGISVIFGHTHSFILRWMDSRENKRGKPGGKGVATTCGVILAMEPRVAIAGFCVWAIITYIFKFSSIGSLTAVWFSLTLGIILKINLYYIVFLFLIALFITYKHRDNIQKLRIGRESKINEKNK